MRLIELFKLKGLLFPTNPEEIVEFENNNANDIKNENPENWETPINIIFQGKRKLSSVDFFQDNDTSDFEELKMVARNGEAKLSKEVIEKMYKKHNNSDDTK